MEETMKNSMNHKEEILISGIEEMKILIRTSTNQMIQDIENQEPVKAYLMGLAN